jgi:hypothetical protein
MSCLPYKYKCIARFFLFSPSVTQDSFYSLHLSHNILFYSHARFFLFSPSVTQDSFYSLHLSHNILFYSHARFFLFSPSVTQDSFYSLHLSHNILFIISYLSCMGRQRGHRCRSLYRSICFHLCADRVNHWVQVKVLSASQLC